MMGVRSVWYSVVVSNGIAAVILYVLYLTGIWKKSTIKVGGNEHKKAEKEAEKKRENKSDEA